MVVTPTLGLLILIYGSMIGSPTRIMIGACLLGLPKILEPPRESRVDYEKITRLEAELLDDPPVFPMPDMEFPSEPR